MASSTYSQNALGEVSGPIWSFDFLLNLNNVMALSMTFIPQSLALQNSLASNPFFNTVIGDLNKRLIITNLEQDICMCLSRKGLHPMMETGDFLQPLFCKNVYMLHDLVLHDKYW